MGIRQDAVRRGLPLGVLSMNTEVSGGLEKVYQCLPSSFSGAPLPESTADEHFVGLLPPYHTSSNWEDGPSRRLPE